MKKPPAKTYHSWRLVQLRDTSRRRNWRTKPVKDYGYRSTAQGRLVETIVVITIIAVLACYIAWSGKEIVETARYLIQFYLHGVNDNM